MTTTKYVWDPDSDNILMETDESDVTTAVYTNKPGKYGGLISQHRDTTTSYYHYDGLGSTVTLTDEAETITDTYSAFGETVTSTGTTENPFRYVGLKGYYYNEELGDYYVRARVYQPEISRWICKDPIGFKDGPNLFLYVNNEPVSRNDPTGLFSFKICCTWKRCCSFSVGIGVDTKNVDTKMDITKFDDDTDKLKAKAKEACFDAKPANSSTDCGSWALQTLNDKGEVAPNVSLVSCDGTSLSDNDDCGEIFQEWQTNYEAAKQTGEAKDILDFIFPCGDMCDECFPPGKNILTSIANQICKQSICDVKVLLWTISD